MQGLWRDGISEAGGEGVSRELGRRASHLGQDVYGGWGGREGEIAVVRLGEETEHRGRVLSYKAQR